MYFLIFFSVFLNEKYRRASRRAKPVVDAVHKLNLH